MERYAAGDNAAFGQVYDLVAPRLYGYALRETRDSTQAEDVVQQTLLHIHHARRSFIRGAPVLPWAFAIARRLLIDAERRRRSERTHVSIERERDQASSSEGLGDEVLGAKQLAAKLQAAFAKLPDNQRVAYQLVREEGLSLNDAAQVIGSTVMALKLRIHRAEEALREADLEPAPAPPSRRRPTDEE